MEINSAQVLNHFVASHEWQALKRNGDHPRRFSLEASTHHQKKGWQIQLVLTSRIELLFMGEDGQIEVIDSVRRNSRRGRAMEIRVIEGRS